MIRHPMRDSSAHRWTVAETTDSDGKVHRLYTPAPRRRSALGRALLDIASGLVLALFLGEVLFILVAFIPQAGA